MLHQVIKLFVFLLLPVPLWAQPVPGFQEMIPREKTGIGLNGFIYGGSNTLTTSFFLGFQQGIHLDSTLLGRSANNLKSSNQAGAVTGASLSGAFYADSAHKIRVVLNLRDRMHFGAAFPDDLYRLVFFGNKAYAGREADFSDTFYRLIRFQQLQAGMTIWQGRAGFALGLVKGERYEDLDVQSGSLYTEPSGKYLDTELVLKRTSSDPDRQGIDVWNGTGYTMDAFVRFPIGKKEERYIFAAIQDLGIIWWNNNSIHQTIDTSLYWDGYEVFNLLDIEDSLDIVLHEDSIISEFVQTHSGPFTTLVPAWLRLEVNIPLNNRLSLRAGTMQALDVVFNPFVFLRGTWAFSDKMKVWSRLAYGGYSSFQAGAGISYTGERWFGGLGLQGLSGILAIHAPASAALNINAGILF